MGQSPTPRKGASPPSPLYWGFAPRELEIVGAILLWPPQPQSSRRALPCPPLVSVDSYGSLCASRKCPQGTRSPPSPIWGCAPKPHARGLARFIFCPKSLASVEEDCPFSGASFPTKWGVEPRSSRGAWGEAPNGNAELTQGKQTKHIIPWGEAPKTGCRGIIPLPGFGVEPQRPPHPRVCFIAGFERTA